jgi:hypothetical protein
METRRWTNPSQPQTLYLAVILLYLNAAFAVLFGGLVNPVALLLIVGQVAAGLGIANEKKWGYVLGVGVATLSLVSEVVLPLLWKLTIVFNPFFLISAVFPVALFALLVHPMSRDYQRVWFR